jgi:hypothetical protein
VAVQVYKEILTTDITVTKGSSFTRFSISRARERELWTGLTTDLSALASPNLGTEGSMGTDFTGCFVKHRLFHETKNARSRTKHDRALNVCKRQVVCSERFLVNTQAIEKSNTIAQKHFERVYETDATTVADLVERDRQLRERRAELAKQQRFLVRHYRFSAYSLNWGL